jgi:acyl-CoA synthetase (AMP-forming)/AMP-acid ligase II
VLHVLLIGAEAQGCTGYHDFVATGAAAAPMDHPSEEALCWLLYTSAGAGLPQGAMLSHRNLLASVMNPLNSWKAARDDMNLYTFPLFHVAGYIMPMYNPCSQPVVLLAAFDPQTLLEKVQRYRVTNTAVAPTMLAMLLEDPKTDDYDLSSVQRFGYGASSMPAEVLRRARAKWPKIGFSTGLDMTELAGNVMFMGRLDHERAADKGLEILRSVGRQLPLSRVRVVDETEADCPPGVSGETGTKGDQVLMGYWRNPEATEKPFVDHGG